MSIDSLVRDWVELIWNQQQFEWLNQFHPQFFQNEGQTTSLDDVIQWHRRMRETYPDLHYVIDDIFATSDRVAVRWTATGTQRGSLWGIIPPSAKTVSWSGMHMLRVVDRQIVQVWGVSNTLSVLIQLGVNLEAATTNLGRNHE